MAVGNLGKSTERTVGIGAISKATGVPVPTLRTWERRYGFPVPVRLPSGHRRYDPTVIEHIRLINRALTSGFRASEVLGQSFEQVLALLAEAAPAIPESPRAPFGIDAMDALIRTITNGDDARLDAAMLTAHARMGTMGFVSDWAGPFLSAVGLAWEAGRITVSEEHLASERVREFLARLWRPLADRNAGPLVVLTTLPGEQHDLGLHMAAAAVAVGGARLRFLGANTPVTDTVGMAQSIGASAVVVSVSAASESPVVRKLLQQIRDRLPVQVQLLVGGAGWNGDISGVTQPESLLKLRDLFRG
ncbi:MAG: methanogenic corrinoid protein MtbC1 [Myxococcota bacterium]|jgi:methanogenic corrinoid protein MtbC1